MDPNRFDSLARTLGSGQSRRRMLRTLAGGAIAAISSAVGFDRADAARLRSVGNSCNSNADCASGLCVQDGRTRKICRCGSEVDCPAATDVCHAASCTAGACGLTVKVDGGCDDGQKCTTNDVCQPDGSCAGTPVVCPTPDQCHTAGACDSATGQCSNPAKQDGKACDDHDAMTCNDVCTGGVCAGTAVDFSNDPVNCGACGVSCAGNTCSKGQCCRLAGTGLCDTDSPAVCCSGVCKPDDAECTGSCPGTCCAPATTCPAGQTCGTASDGCGATLSCGDCPRGQGCQEGACQALNHFSCACNDGQDAPSCRTAACTIPNMVAICSEVCAAHGGTSGVSCAQDFFCSL